MSADPLPTGKLKVFQALGADLKGDRLAIDALLACAAGNDLAAAIERLEGLREALPEQAKGRQRGGARTFNDLIIRTREMLDLAIHDLRQLEEHSAKTSSD